MATRGGITSCPTLPAFPGRQIDEMQKGQPPAGDWPFCLRGTELPDELQRQLHVAGFTGADARSVAALDRAGNQPHV